MGSAAPARLLPGAAVAFALLTRAAALALALLTPLAALALALLTPLAARGGGTEGRGRAGDPFAARDAHGALAQQRQRLESFRAQREYEAHVRRLDAERDAELRRAERELARSGSLEDLRRHAERAQAREASDELRLRSQLESVSAEASDAWLARQGPVTRRVLIESGIAPVDTEAGLALRRARREAELRARTRALEQEIRRRQPPVTLDRDARGP
jgi:hypothetical protein